MSRKKFSLSDWDYMPLRVNAECGYQDVECWVRQLRAAGWLPVSARTLKEVAGSNTWLSPNGSLYRGPYRAWTVLRYQECIRHHSKTCTCGSIALRESARKERGEDD